MRIFDYPAVIGFSQKIENYGYGTKSRWGPPGVHLGANGVPFSGQNRKKLPRGDRFFPKNVSHGYGAKSRWGLPRVHLGANGVPLGPKNGSKPWKLPCPKIRIFVNKMGQNRKPSIFPKNGSYGYGTNSRWGHHRVHLGANGVPLGKKMGQNRKKLPCPKMRIFDYPAVIDFSQNMEVTVIAPHHGGDPLGSILGTVGSHWVKKNGSKP